MKNQMNLNEIGVSSMSHEEMKEVNGGFWGLIALGIILVGIVIKTIEIINRD